MSSPKVISGCAWIALSTRSRSSSFSFGLRPQLPVRRSTLPVSRICAASLYTSRSLTPYACAIIFALWVRSYPATSRLRVSLLNILFHLGLIIPLFPDVSMNSFSPIALIRSIARQKTAFGLGTILLLLTGGILYQARKFSPAALCSETTSIYFRLERFSLDV